MENTSTAYYAARVRFNHLLEHVDNGSADAAALFYYLNRTGYNGLCRFNNQGGFNIPFGRYDQIEYKTKADFDKYKPVFARFEFMNRDFEKLPVKDDDFIYADPPYVADRRSSPSVLRPTARRTSLLSVCFSVSATSASTWR
jgi:DNA adenine methylase